jgi:hypothetical protein
LSDTGPMAWSLYLLGASRFGPKRLAQILRIVEAEAVLYELIDPLFVEDEAEAEDEA